MTSRKETNIQYELRLWSNELKQRSYTYDIRVKSNASLINGISQYILDWTIITLCFIYSREFIYFIPIGILITGSRQRALSNLIHDACHYNLTRNKCINDFICNTLSGIPLISFVDNYRRSHFLHHKFLGNKKLDPDASTHISYGYDDGNPPHRSWFYNLLFLIFNFAAWKESNTGTFQDLNNSRKLKVILWWIALVNLLTLAYDSKTALLFVLFWQISRATSYHIIRITVEFLDHSGLQKESIFQGTRIIENNSLILEFFLHPHNDKYHALHHLSPSIPNYNLKIVHNIINNRMILYMKIKKNNGYITHQNSALKDLQGIVS
ncbi:MAG: fatty acid desaturase [Pseudobdellovibrio sp.]